MPKAVAIDVLLRASNRDLFALFVHRRQLQGFQVMLQQHGAFRFEFLH